MKTTTHRYNNRGRKAMFSIALLLLIPISARGATVFASLTSQDRIVGARQSGGDALGYYADTTNRTVGVAGGTSTRVNTNMIIGFTLPTLNLGESISAASFSITVGSKNGSAFTVALFGLTETNPDATGITLFSQSGSGAINSAFTSTAAADNSTPLTDVTTFIQSLYTGITPNQTEVFFRLNQTSSLGISLTDRIAFTADSAALTLTVIPEPNAAALIGGCGVLSLLRRRRNG